MQCGESEERKEERKGVGKKRKRKTFFYVNGECLGFGFFFFNYII